MNNDIIVTRKMFLAAPAYLQVTSIFRTIQGEGPYTGRPAVFVRLAGCNFGDKQDHCSWCDTSFQLDKAEAFTKEALLAAVLALPGYSPSDILVITGGEPTLQEALGEFIYDASPHFKMSQLETNGTQAYFFAMFGDLPKLYVVVSPKASLKLGGYAPLSSTVLTHTDCLKFVLSADPDSVHHEVPEWAVKWQRDTYEPVYVSPMTVYTRAYQGEISSIWDDYIDKEQTKANYAYAAQYAMDNNLWLSLQTHLFTAIP